VKEGFDFIIKLCEINWFHFGDVQSVVQFDRMFQDSD